MLLHKGLRLILEKDIIVFEQRVELKCSDSFHKRFVTQETLAVYKINKSNYNN